MNMVDKKILKIYIIALTFSSITIFTSYFMNTYEKTTAAYFTFPMGVDTKIQELFFLTLAFLAPYLMIFVGYAIAYLVVRIYGPLTKLSKRIEFVGYASTDRSGHYLRRRYIIQVFFATLLCTNIWISLVTNSAILEFFIAEEAKEFMYTQEGTMLNFPMIPLYWIPLVVVVPIIAMCAVIQDSGLVSIKKLSGQEFVDTERIGDKIFGIVKGYAGIAVIISFITLLQSPMGRELSLVLYPLMATAMSFHIIVAIDMFKDIGRKWVFKAVKPTYPPQMVELSYVKKDIADFKDLK